MDNDRFWTGIRHTHKQYRGKTRKKIQKVVDVQLKHASYKSNRDKTKLAI
jgi:hypothetical protein